MEEGKTILFRVIGLAEFKVVASVHPQELAALTGSYRDYDPDRRGNLAVRSYTPYPQHAGDELSIGGGQVKMAMLTLPRLDVSDQCEYSEWTRAGSTRREGDESCKMLPEHEGGFPSVANFMDNFQKADEVSRTDSQARPPQPPPFGYARYLSRDGRYEREVCLTFHRGFWGNPVVTRHLENIFSAETRKQVGSVEEPASSVDSRFASVDGQEYLLVMEGGSRLTVYHISE